MTALSYIKNSGQSIWLGDITRCAIEGDTLRSGVDRNGITGAAISASALYRDIREGQRYDKTINDTLQNGVSGAELLNLLFSEDIRHMADILRPVHERTERMDGWVLAPLSPLICTQSEEENLDLGASQARINRPNVLYMVPGRLCSATCIEEAVCSGHPIAISQICSARQYTQVAESYLTGVKRRIALGMQSGATALAVVPIMRILALLFNEMQPAEALQVSVAVARDIYRAMRELHTSPVWEKVYGAGARPLRILWMNIPSGSTAPMAAPLACRLAAPLTMTAIPQLVLENLENTDWKLPGVHEHDQQQPGDGKDMACLQQFAPLADRMQAILAVEEEKEWILLRDAIASKCAALAQQPRMQPGGIPHATLLGSRQKENGAGDSPGGDREFGKA